MALVHQEGLVEHSYVRGADIFAEAAAQFGVTMPEGRIDEWRNLLQAARVLDDLLDSDQPQQERESDYQHYLRAMLDEPDEPIAPQHEALFSDIRRNTQHWTTKKTDQLVSLAYNVMEIAATKRELTSARRLAKVALQEGSETARLFAFENPQTSGEEDFNCWLEGLLRFGVVVDTALDLPEDYQHELTQVLPTARNRLIVVGYSISELGFLARTPRGLLKPLFVAAGALADDTHNDSRKRSK